MPEHLTRDQRVLYDHEDEAPRRRQADDWGIDESFPRVRGRRFARAQEGPARSRRRPVEDWGIPDAEPEPVAEEPAGVEEEPQPVVESDERRTIRIYGRPGEPSENAPFVSARRRPPPTVSERMAGEPTRIIAWAFLLGLLLILIAIATA